MSGRPAPERRAELVELYRSLEGHRCSLAATRTRVVFGAGNADADLMFVGEAPGAEEDRIGRPFVGRAGRLLDELLAEAGLAREEAFVANVLKCRPPANRDPRPEEIEECTPHLLRQIELIEPRVVCTLGNFATKLLSGSPLGITRVHGRPQTRTLGARTVRLYPLFHPAAALRTPAVREALREDLKRLGPLLAAEREPRAGQAVETDSPERTEASGAALARALAPGDVVLLSGELGSGKTTFVRGACRALGVEGAVTSPTFAIGQLYGGRRGGAALEVAHLDLYRMPFLAAGDAGLLEDYLTPERIAFVEWPGHAEPSLERIRARVRLEHRGEGRRAIGVSWDEPRAGSS